MDIAEWVKNEEIQRNFRKAGSAAATAVYNEMYIYICFICVYNIFLLLVVVINLYFLIKIWRTLNGANCVTSSFVGSV